jgi:hypothetical protein
MDAVDVTYAWFEVNSGWAPPEADELAEWLADGVCRAPDDCLVAPEGTCPHGLVSWKRVLDVADTRGRPGPQGRSPSSE